MTSTIRPLADADVNDVVQLSIRAWAPVFESVAKVLGPEILAHIYGADWRIYQENDVRATCAAKPTWVAEAAGFVAGFTALDLSSNLDEGEIYMLAVDPSFQQRGLGTTLTRFGIEQIRAAGKKVAVVGTGGDPGHEPARHIYSRAGFTSLPIVRSWMIL